MRAAGTGSAVVTLTVWGVGPARVPAALARMALDRRPLRTTPGLRFAKLLGTGNGRTFTLRDADPLHWGLVAVWEGDGAAAGFAASGVSRGWDRISDERLEVRMTPLACRGSWSRQQPFGVLPPGRRGAPAQEGEPVASITRARLRPSRALSFWRAVPPVSADLSAVAGLRLAIGIGEAPIGLQGTFSLWSDADALNQFAYRRPAHLEVVRRTQDERWYTEELFARFAVQSITGTFAGRHPMAD